MNIKLINLFLIGSIVTLVIFSGCSKDEDDSSNNNESDTSSGLAPIADFIVSDTNVYEGVTISFLDKSTNSPESWRWDFGDGKSSNEQNPSHTYGTIGSYTISLTVVNYYGDDNEIKTDYITINEEPPSPNSFTDNRDGEIYEWVEIGSQTWMAENLAYIGNEIEHITDNNEWSVNSDYDGWSYYDNDINNKHNYGVLYQWEAAKRACPIGWHLPSKAEWETLINYLGGELVAGGKMKETGTYHWNSPNTGATNSSGFTAVPSGFRMSYSGDFLGLNSDGLFWSSTEEDSLKAYYSGVNANYNKATINSNEKLDGRAVRCIKD